MTTLCDDYHMNNWILAFLALLFYGIATVWQSTYFKRRVLIPGKGPLISGFAAVFIHTILLYHWIDIGIGQNLSVFNLLSLVIWLVALLILFTSFSKPVANLVLFIYPIAAFSIVLALYFPQFVIINTAAKPLQLMHILLSTLAFSILCIAAFQAIMLAIQEHLLRRKHAIRSFQILPPLEIMETLLFQMLAVGFILLTAVLLTSLWAFYPNLFTVFWQKSLLAFVTWLVFVVLLTGRWLFGWRGQQVVRWTLSGVFFVMLTYFSSEFL